MARSPPPPPLLLLALLPLLLKASDVNPSVPMGSSTGKNRSEHTVTSPSSALSSVSLATLPWSPTHPKPSTLPPSVSLATTDRTFETSDYAPGDSEALRLHRNPGVVVAVCLLVSAMLIGGVIMAVRRCHNGVSEFQKLDEGLVSRRSSSAHHRLP
ncbi:hypothetical protein MG293_008990 [Ovis ammon polii]|uniref:Uncharacterized protein n=1 Tax=Ovis ammon polii TaxID=230172 RepID=A0AAD4U7D5_OVIAM|nr:hypothetical protein MG293_008990 [Ovis ammon polii]